jgi:hypothetical protein
MLWRCADHALGIRSWPTRWWNGSPARPPPADVNVEQQLLMPLDELLNPNTPTAAEMACDASIRHLDHVHRRVDGGPTTMANGRGLCERGNYVHEMPGWQATVIEDGRHGHPHTVVITTPTGHSYTNSAPQPP